MATHSIPKIWRQAEVSAIEKPGKDPKLAASYRPVSLLSTYHKLLERLALQRISPAVKELLSPDQAGVWKARSTFDQAAAMTAYTENVFSSSYWRCLLDLTAAYDTVWHTGLLYKLSKCLPYWFTRPVTPAPAEPNETASHKVLY